MRFLLSNDDGYRAPGLTVLAAMLKNHGEVVVVAPDRDRSGASNSLTLDAPLRLTPVGQHCYSVNGTPTDCVHLAITGALNDFLPDFVPDMVISGINAGANLGDDVLYSGTVAAAMEGRFLGFPALAVSAAGERVSDFSTAARVVETLLLKMRQHPLAGDSILNINVPDCAIDQLQGYEITRLGHRHPSLPAIRALDPRGRPVYWVGAPGSAADASAGSDFHAIANQYVSITPLTVDLTHQAHLVNLSAWLQR